MARCRSGRGDLPPDARVQAVRGLGEISPILVSEEGPTPYPHIAP